MFSQLVDLVMSNLDFIKIDVTTAMISIIGICVLILGIGIIRNIFTGEVITLKGSYKNSEDDK